MTWNNKHIPKNNRSDAAMLPVEKNTTIDETRKMTANPACRSQKALDV